MRNMTRKHDEAVIELLRDDPTFAVEYLNEIFADGDQEEMMTALRRVAEANGGVSTVAEAAKLNSTTIYRTLSPKGNPELKSFMALLGAMGMRLSITPVPSHA